MSPIRFYISTIFLSTVSFAQINVKKVTTDLSQDYQSVAVWQNADKEFSVSLMAQPMVTPKPKQTSVANIFVTALHDGKNLALRLRWSDPQVNDSDKLKSYSDAVAVQFPINDNLQPPAVIMGHQGNPVHIFHWRYQYQMDVKQGSKREIQQIYPNMTVDMYPQDYKFTGNIPKASQEQKDAFLGGTAAGNPKSYYKPQGIDELMAEGFSTTVTRPNPQASALGVWENNEWKVYILRPLKYQDGSSLQEGGKSHVAFAVWQGENEEVGSMKSLTMAWTPLLLMER